MHRYTATPLISPISIVSSPESVARRLKFQSTFISNLAARAAAQDLVIRSLVTELNRQARCNQGAVSAAYLLCHSLPSDSGPVPQEVCVPYNVNRVVHDPVPHYAQRVVEICIPNPVQKDSNAPTA